MAENISAEDVCKILEACRNLGVKKLKHGDLLVEFYDPKGTPPTPPAPIFYNPNVPREKREEYSKLSALDFAKDSADNSKGQHYIEDVVPVTNSKVAAEEMANIMLDSPELYESLQIDSLEGE